LCPVDADAAVHAGPLEVGRREKPLKHCDSYLLIRAALAKLEEASIHKSAKIHAGNVFVTRDLDR